MAGARQPVVNRKAERAFESVFPKGGTKPPKHHQIFEPKAEGYIHRFEEALMVNSRTALGIGDENFIYASSQRYEVDLPCYKTHFESCPPMTVISPPNDADWADRELNLARLDLWSPLREWQHQLGGNRMRKAFAKVLDILITEFVKWAYSGIYDEGVVPHLHFWIEYIFSSYVVYFLKTVRYNDSEYVPFGESEVALTDKQRWREMALTRLGGLRVDELFDIIVEWDETQSGIEDLKQYATNPSTRTYLTNSFAGVLSTRLLHPGASTVQILQLYISIIRAFRRLDPKGVLLERVARLIRRYLRDRDDTVKVIVAGLLTDPVNQSLFVAPSSPEILTELALELRARDVHAGDQDDNELDWNNTEWMPDPIDAAPDHIKSKNTDVIGSLISLFETKGVFVRELEVRLAERLLGSKSDFEQEISVIEHLKARFGDAALQNCEVMLRDVVDSRKIDSAIWQDQGMQTMDWAVKLDETSFHAKILSRLFWPAVQDQTFKVPAEIREAQKRYEKGFESLKQSRKLTWLNSVGQVEVELELEGRVFRDKVIPFQAGVIHAFGSDSDDGGGGNSREPVSHTISELAEMLEMSPRLVEAACNFWSLKRILVETSKDTYTVLERLPDGNAAAAMSPLTAKPDAVAAAEAAAAQAAKEAEETDRRQKMAVYHEFVMSMLTNQGAMPLSRIAMMLGIVVPGGFPFSNEELKEFLAAMVSDGKLEIGHGGVYKVVPM